MLRIAGLSFLFAANLNRSVQLPKVNIIGTSATNGTGKVDVEICSVESRGEPLKLKNSDHFLSFLLEVHF
jgi:hypothetical protein